MIRFLVLICFFSVTSCLFAGVNNPNKRTYKASRIEDPPPLIDGRLDEAAWQKAAKTGDFVQLQPYEGQKPSQETEFAILYDENNIYVAIWAWDSSPDSISKRLSRRDDIDGDVVGIDIDSYYDRRTAFGFWVSASGVKLDRIVSNDGSTEDDTWDPVWYVGTEINDRGWTAEMRIPLSQLRFGSMVNQVWGIEVMRSLFRKDEVSLWSPVPRNASGYVHLYGDLEGIEGIRPRKQMDFTPYTVALAKRFEKDPDNPFNASGHSYKYTAGVDAKIGLTNNFILDLTVNPDFGQVEADPSEVNLSAFETFFEEKRPFFIEGRSILSMPLMLGDGDLANENLFYTRRIGRRPHRRPGLMDGEYPDMNDFSRILGAAKLTGKTNNGWSIGLLESFTARETAEIRFGDESRIETIEPMTNYLIGTVRKDFNEGNTIVSGMLTATNRILDDYTDNELHRSAYSAGFDFTQFFKNKTYMLMMKTYFSEVKGNAEAIRLTQESSAHYYQRPDATYVRYDTLRTSLMGNGGTMFFGRVGNARLQYGFFLTWKTPGVDLNDVGYVRMTDQVLPIFWAGYRFTEPFGIVREINLGTNHWTGFDFGGRYQGYGGNINGHVTFKNLWSMSGGLNWDTESLDNYILRGGPAFRSPAMLRPFIYISSDNRKKLKFEANAFAMRDFVDHYRMEQTRLEVSYRPLNTLVISLVPYYTRINNNLQYMNTVSFKGDPRYVFGNLTQNVVGMSFRVNLTLTPNLTFQYWGQPFIATGVYNELKMIDNPLADRYEDRFQVFDNQQIECYKDEGYCMIDEDRDAVTDYSVDYPDFNVKEFKSNLVVRWEYRPGSVIYLVWSQGRSGYDGYGDFEFGRDFSNLFRIYPNDIFLVKFSYRFGL